MSINNTTRLKKQGNYIEEQLYSIIVNSKGRPDHLAIAIYSYLKSWFKPNRNNSLKKGDKFYVKDYGFRTSYEELAKKYFCSKELIRQKIVLLEQLGLLSRSFRIEYDRCGIRKNNVLHLLLWKETPYFEFEFGVEKTITYLANLDKETWEEIQEKISPSDQNIYPTPSKKLEVTPPRKEGRALQADLDIIYSNTTLYTTLVKTDLADLGGAPQQLSDKNGKLQDQQNQFQNELLLQDQRVCINTEAQVENITSIQIARDSKGIIPTEQCTNTINEASIGEIVRDLDLDYDYRSVTIGDTQYMAPIRRVEEVKCYNFKEEALKYLESLEIEPQNKEQEKVKNKEQESKKPQENQTSSVSSREPVYMTIEQMREAMAKDKAKRQVSSSTSQTPVSIKPKKEATYVRTVPSGTYNNKLLKDFKLTPELFDAIRSGSNKPHFSDDRITAVIQNIIANNPETQIWGGKHAFIRYMVKAVNNEKEYTKAEIGQSIADKNRQHAEELQYQFENQIILWG